ncbi:MAG TPA: M43 family zinc metalloprotease, partial [Luteibaculaceae bacterium]|nr:M43 family zinc metalloprotease [Luteibaculaceae bacterium]
MTKFYRSTLLVAALMTAGTAFSQTQQVPSGDGFNCSHQVVMEQLFHEHPEMKADYEAQQKVRDEIAKKLYENRNDKNEQVYIIPVVFHIVHAGGSENISDAQVQNAIDVMNQEFRKTNPAAANIDPYFASRAADSKIEFRLATIDPQGNCTNGINRYFDSRTEGADDAIKNGRQWPTNKYLNVYTVRTIGSGAAGYAYYPANNNQARDGIVILHSYVGNIGTGSPGRQSAFTHEAGHYLNLAHTWGNSNTPGAANNCGSDDGVTDTPLCAGSSVCNLNLNTCNDGTANDEKDNIQNFMEYAYCYAMYTEGQKARMRAALTSTAGGRNNLWSEANLAATGSNYTSAPVNLCKADFAPSTNKPICQGNTVSFTDYSYNNVSSWSWSFPGGTPSTSTERNPTVTYNTPGTYDVTLTV